MAQPGNLDELVRIESDSIRFPRSCPVCGRPTAAYGTVTSSKGLRVMKRRGHGAHLRRDRWVLEVPVCEGHADSANLVKRLMPLLIVIASMSLIALLYSVAAIGMSVLDRRPVYSHFLLMLFIGLLITPLLFRILGPSKLERIITVLRTESAGRYLVLRIRNPTYLQEMLELNSTAVRPTGISQTSTESRQ